MDLEETLTSYGNDAGEGAVPEALLQSAVSVGSQDPVRAQSGPADAVASESSADEEDEDRSAASGLKASSLDKATHMPFHGAVLENNIEHSTVLQDWNAVVRNVDVLGLSLIHI